MFIAIIVIIFGSISWLLTMFKSGLVYFYGIGFWGPNGHDAIWHLALIESLKRGSLENPVFAGEQIKNYHIGFDLFLAWISNFTFIPALNLYFQVLPLITAFLIGYLTYLVVLKWTNSNIQATWSVFFVYFGGSFGYIVSLMREQTVGGESLFWSQQGISTLINPPFAFSLVILLAGLLLLLSYLEKRSIIKVLGIVFCFSLLLQVKVYAGILGLGGLIVAGLYDLYKNKKPNVFVIGLLSTLVSAILFFPLNKNSTSLIVFQPFWFLETMMAVSDRFYWPKFYEAMMNYRLGNVWHKAILAYMIAFFIYLVGNLGTRIVSFLEIWHRLRKIEVIDVYLVSIAGAGIVLPLLILQKGTPWNTIQFLYYTLFVASVYAGVWTGRHLRLKKPVNIVYAIIVVLMTVPSTYATLKHYLPNRPPAMIPNEELEALEFLAKQPLGVVLTYPYDKDKALKAVSNPPRPLYLYESTAYVSAFSKKPVYLEDEVNLNITGYDWRKRRLEIEEWLSSQVHEYVPQFLRKRNIKYVYWVKPQRAVLGEQQIGMKLIFENTAVNIYEVQ